MRSSLSPLSLLSKERGKGHDVYVGNDGNTTRAVRLGKKHGAGCTHEGCAHVHGMLFTTEEFFRYTERGLSKLSAQVLMDLAVHLVTHGFNDQIWTWRAPENNQEIRNVSNVMGMYI